MKFIYILIVTYKLFLLWPQAEMSKYENLAQMYNSLKTILLLN